MRGVIEFDFGRCTIVDSFLSSLEIVHNKNNEIYNLGLPELDIVYLKNSNLTNINKLDIILINLEKMFRFLKNSKNG